MKVLRQLLYTEVVILHLLLC